MCNCCVTCDSLLSAKTDKGCKHGGLLDPLPLICSLLDPTAPVDGQGGDGEVARTVFVWTKNGSGFQRQPQHTPAWLSASERRVPPHRHRLRRKASRGSVAGVCVCDTVAAQWVSMD